MGDSGEGPAWTPIHTLRTLPEAFQDLAVQNPQGVCAKFPISKTPYGSGFRSVTRKEALNAVNYLAWLLEEKLGKGKDFPVLVYVGPNDFRYSIVVVACIKAGYQSFLPSPRNSKVAFHTLLKTLGCKTLLTTLPELPCVSTILEGHEMSTIHIPELQVLLDCTDVPDYPYNKTFENAKKEPTYILHTSGSTELVNAPGPERYKCIETRTRTGSFFCALPPFHAGGLSNTLLIPTFHRCIPVYPLPNAPPTTEGLIEAINNTEVNWALVAPVTLDEIGKNPPLLDAVASKLDSLYYSGGSLPQASGDAIAARMGLYQIVGSSECGIFPSIRECSDRTCQDWNWLQFNPAVNFEFRHRVDDLHELIVMRDYDHPYLHPVFFLFPETDLFETRDLFSRHPTKANLWKHRGRIDDVIVFLNGEKTNPISFELEVGTHPEVRSALVAGEQRFEACLLVELIDNKALSLQEKSETIDRIWPIIQQANNQCPTHAKISKSRVILVEPEMPMMRAGKGIVQRQATWNLYSAKMEDLYSNIEAEVLSNLPPAFDLRDYRSVSTVVHEILTYVTQWDRLGDHEDLFALGMDSLQVLRASRALESKFRMTSFAARDLYSNATADLLTTEIMHKVSRQSARDHEEKIIDANVIASMLDEYRKEIDKIAKLSQLTKPQGRRELATLRVMILTGSTGALGSFILQKLLESEDVQHIYCFNRAKGSESVQMTRNIERGIHAILPDSRVTFLTVDLSKPSLGLDENLFTKISNSATQIIHNAWPVDFNRTLPSFKSSLDGIVGLICFAAQCRVSPSITFLSSVSSVTNYHKTQDAELKVPEEIVSGLASPASMGYGQSKYLAERMFDYAAYTLKQDMRIIRVGQIAGTAKTPRGWSRNEWLPSLVLSSHYVGALPETLGAKGSSSGQGLLDKIDWIPIDRLACIVIEISLSLGDGDQASSTRIYHAVNPYPTTWQELLPTVQDSLSRMPSGGKSRPSTTALKTLPFPAWLDLLQAEGLKITNDIEARSTVAQTIHQNPGVKLIDFYATLLDQDQADRRAKLSTEKTVKISKELRDLEPIQKEWFAGWIARWVEGQK